MEKSYHEIKKALKLAGKEGFPVPRGSAGYLPDEKAPVPSEARQDLIDRAIKNAEQGAKGRAQLYRRRP